MDAAAVPPVMMNPALLPPGQAWVQRCTIDFTTVDAEGRVLLRHPCGLDCQGGTAGLAAHQRLVHGGVQSALPLAQRT